MNLLEEKVLRQLTELDSACKTKKYLLAVSGGSDSTCLVTIFKQLGLNFEMAHCNFQLRGSESDGDEEFVKELSSKIAVKAHLVRFETRIKAGNNKTSIQEEARSLRYVWFKDLAKQFNFDYIVTAHHQDDLIETFFINTMRGSGIKGLKSIPQVNKNVIRPMLSVSKDEINKYLLDLDINYRNDSSNESLKYSRNYLRHEIIPKLDYVHPNAKKGIVKTIQNIVDAEDYLNHKIEEDKKKLIKVEGGFVKINLDLKPTNFILFTILSEYGFNKTQLINLLETEQKGSIFYSELFMMFKENKSIIISSKVSTDNEFFTFKNFGEYNDPLKISFSEENNNDLEFKNNIAYFDTDKVQFPFVLRKWKEGDWFVPFGMKGKKKLSDFFIDLKLNKIEKEAVWILESNNKICWIVGKRIDNRFKVTKKTTKIIKIVTK